MSLRNTTSLQQSLDNLIWFCAPHAEVKMLRKMLISDVVTLGSLLSKFCGNKIVRHDRQVHRKLITQCIQNSLLTVSLFYLDELLMSLRGLYIMTRNEVFHYKIFSILTTVLSERSLRLINLVLS